MTATFFGGAVGTAVSGWIMSQYGWSGIVAFGIALGLLAAVLHWAGGRKANLRVPGGDLSAS